LKAIEATDRYFPEIRRRFVVVRRLGYGSCWKSRTYRLLKDSGNIHAPPHLPPPPSRHPAAKLAHAADDDLIIAINQTTLESAALMIQKIPGVLVRPMPSGRAAFGAVGRGHGGCRHRQRDAGLLSSVSRPELRVVLTLAECRYRMVARWSAGVSKVADLRGKRIAFYAEYVFAVFFAGRAAFRRGQV